MRNETRTIKAMMKMTDMRWKMASLDLCQTPGRSSTPCIGSLSAALRISSLDRSKYLSSYKAVPASSAQRIRLPDAGVCPLPGPALSRLAGITPNPPELEAARDPDALGDPGLCASRSGLRGRSDDPPASPIPAPSFSPAPSPTHPHAPAPAPAPERGERQAYRAAGETGPTRTLRGEQGGQAGRQAGSRAGSQATAYGTEPSPNTSPAHAPPRPASPSQAGAPHPPAPRTQPNPTHPNPTQPTRPSSQISSPDDHCPGQSQHLQQQTAAAPGRTPFALGLPKGQTGLGG